MRCNQEGSVSGLEDASGQCYAERRRACISTPAWSMRNRWPSLSSSKVGWKPRLLQNDSTCRPLAALIRTDRTVAGRSAIPFPLCGAPSWRTLHLDSQRAQQLRQYSCRGIYKMRDSYVCVPSRRKWAALDSFRLQLLRGQ